jgi:tetratricopeptide (TPR) repeat protein
MEMNQEGIAELDYSRGVAANDNGKLVEAKEFVSRSLDESRKIQSVQLQIRDLVQLSSLEKSSPAQAAEYAKQAIRLARENQLDAWAADGLVRLAGADLDSGNLQEAEDSVQDALQLAHQTQQHRVEASANLILASVMNQKHLPDQVIGPAQLALNFYGNNGFFRNAASASILLIRAKRDQGQYQEALKSGNAFLALSTQSGISPLMVQAEELMGTIYLQKEEYPDALNHFQKALSQASNSTRVYEALYAADTLWRLGLYDESEQMLNFDPANDRIAIAVGQTREELLLSKAQNGQAYTYAGQLLAKYPKMAAADQEQIILDKMIAEARLGMKQQVLKDLASLQNEQPGKHSTEDWKAVLAIAEANLSVGSARQAYEGATRAAGHFASTGQLDSELRSVCLAALAAKASNNLAEYKASSAKAIDILSKIQQTWSPQLYKTYVSRPDIRILIQRISLMTESKGRSS